jgi:hypothetical protein
MQRSGHEHWMAALLEKMLIFLFQFSLIVLGLYVLGNFQKFLDRSQNILLQTLIVSTLLGGILSFYWMVYQIFTWFILRRFRIGKFFACVSLFVFNMAILIIFKFFVSWFQI